MEKIVVDMPDPSFASSLKNLGIVVIITWSQESEDDIVLYFLLLMQPSGQYFIK